MRCIRCATCPHVIDIRNIGLIGADRTAPIAGEPTKRAFNRLPQGLSKIRKGC
jgi:beta-alanine--pyruvate transaminase